jgi:hypothetical protein
LVHFIDTRITHVAAGAHGSLEPKDIPGDIL